MSYSKRHGWCSSSIPTTLCPSNVDKSTQPCPLLSSPLYSPTLLLTSSNSHCISINTDTISTALDSEQEEEEEEEKDQGTTHALSSSLEYSHDYYTRKRIEQLHKHMDDIQISSFLKFINYHLSSKNEKKFVKDLSQDLSNGHILIDLIEIFSSTKLKREYGHTRFHSLTNVQYVLDYLKLHMQHINISPHDIVSGNRKQILALLWIIMKVFDFPSFHITTNKYIYNESNIFSMGQDRGITLKWINSLLNKISSTNIIYIRDFSLTSWIDTSYLLLIIKYLCPFSLKHGTTDYFQYLKQLNDLDLINQKQKHFEFCIKFTTYCFNIMTTVDYTDRTEKCLFRFFAEFRVNILFILKSTQIGKLTKTNPYTKQLLDSVLEVTMIDDSPVVNEDDDYLINDDEQQQSPIDQSDNTEKLPSSIDDSCNDELIKHEETIIPEASPLSTIINHIQEEQQPIEISSSLTEQNALKSRKVKKKKLTVSVEKLSSIMVPTETSNGDLFVKIIECLHDRKLMTFKYVFILACLIFFILIIFIHK